MLRNCNCTCFLPDKPLRWYWGLIQFYSLVFSLVSLLQTLIHFNEWPKRRHTLHRFMVIVPFFLVTLFYRVRIQHTRLVSYMKIVIGRLSLRSRSSRFPSC